MAMQPGRPIGRRLTAAVFFFWMVSLLPAQAPPGGTIPSAIWDASAALSPPSWFGPVQTSVGANMTVWRSAVRPPPGQSRLAVTLLFEESQGGFARLIWQGPNRAVTVCGNLYEGAAPFHARTLLLDRETLVGPGQLIFEATGNRPVLVRAELSWVEPLVLAAAGRTPPGLFLSSSGKIFPADELHGQGRRAPEDEIRDDIVDAVLDAGPLTIPPQTPIRLLVPVSTTPTYARLEGQVAGLKPGEEPMLWINGRALGTVAVQLPGLEDPGYRWLSGSKDLSYGGWRTLTAHVPAGWLSAGENQLDWSCPPDSSGMTVRNLRLQLAYDRLAKPTTPSWPVPVAPVTVASLPASPPVPVKEKPVVPRLRAGLSSGSLGVGLRSE